MSNLFNARECEFVRVDGVWLPGVASVEINPVYIGDHGRAVSGALRSAHVGVAREWRVLLTGVDSDHTIIVDELVSNPTPVGCVVMGEEVIASVRLVSSAFVPKRRGSNVDWGRRNYELLIQEAFVEQITPGFTYEYVAFLDTGPFVWDWNAAGQPDEVDVLLVAGGGGGANGTFYLHGWGGGGAGGVRIDLGVPVSSNVSGSVGAGGSPGSNGQDTTFGALPPAIGGGFGGGLGGNSSAGGDGGSGGGSRRTDSSDPGPGSGTPGQGHAGGQGSYSVNAGGGGNTYGGGGGGGGAGQAGHDGGHASRDQSGAGGNGGMGVDLLSVGWNHRMVPGAPRFVGGGGGGSSGQAISEWTRAGPAGAGGIGGGGMGARIAQVGGTAATPGQPNTGGGGGGGSGPYPGASGGSGLVIVRWLVNL